MIECTCLSVVLQDQELVDPVHEQKVHHSDRVQDGHTSRVAHYSPEVCEIMGIHLSCLDFMSCVKLFNLVLDGQFSVDLVIIKILLRIALASSIQALEDLFEIDSNYFTSMRDDGVDKDSHDQLGSNVSIPIHIEVFVLAIE